MNQSAAGISLGMVENPMKLDLHIYGLALSRSEMLAGWCRMIFCVHRPMMQVSRYRHRM